MFVSPEGNDFVIIHPITTIIIADNSSPLSPEMNIVNESEDV